MKRSSSELKSIAREMLLGHYGIPMAAALLSLVIPSCVLWPFSYLSDDLYSLSSQTIIYYAASILVSLLQVPFIAGVFRIHLQIGRNKPYKLMDVFYFFKNHPDRFLIGGLLLYLLQLLPFLPALIYYLLFRKTVSSYAIRIGIFILLLIAGAILSCYLQIRFALVILLYADCEEYGVLEAFKQSSLFMSGHKFRYFTMILSFLGWLLLSILSIGIGFLWIQPYMNQTIVNFYLDLKHEFDVQLDISKDALDHIQSTSELN